VLLDSFFEELVRVYAQCIERLEASDASGRTGGLGSVASLSDEAVEELRSDVVLIMCDLQSAQRQLSLINEVFMKEMRARLDNASDLSDLYLSGMRNSMKKVATRGRLSLGSSGISSSTAVNVHELIGYVEVRWGNRTEPVCFVLPEDHKELQESTKALFLDKVNLVREGRGWSWGSGFTDLDWG
jgi:hypothetical protein